MPTLHTALSDYIVDEEPQEFPVFVGLRKGTSGLGWTQQYVLCFECLCTAYPFESGELTA